MQNINYSWTPYYYHPKYGSGRRVISVLVENNSKTCIILHALQTSMLFLACVQQFYNGFIVYRHLATNKDQLWETIELQSHIATQSKWKNNLIDIIIKIYTYNHFYGTGEHSRRINIIGFTFTLQALLRKVQFSLRKQHAQVSQPFIGTDSNSPFKPSFKPISTENSDEVNDEICFSSKIFMRYIEFLTEPKLTLLEYVRYCYCLQPLNDRLSKQYPSLIDLPDDKILQVDLTSIRRENAFVCRAKVARIVYGVLLVILPSIIIGSFFLMAGVKSLVYINGYTGYNFNTIKGASSEILKFLYAWNFFITAILIFYDSWFCFITTQILLDRQDIFDRQLAQCVESCRAWHASIYRDERARRKSSDKHSINNPLFVSLCKKSPTRRFSKSGVIMNGQPKTHCKHNNDDSNINYYSNLNNPLAFRLLSKRIIEATKLDLECRRLIIALHQLIFEFKQMKLIFQDDALIDLTCAFLSIAWFSKMIVESYKCQDCHQLLAVNLFTGIVAVAYVLEILVRMVGMASISRKVNNTCHVIQLIHESNINSPLFHLFSLSTNQLLLLPPSHLLLPSFSINYSICYIIYSLRLSSIG